VVHKDYVLDYTDPLKNVLMEEESGAGGLTYRYTYGLGKSSAVVYGVPNGAGSVTQSYIYPNGAADVVKLYIHGDRLGTAHYMTDNVDGKVAGFASYDDWGAPTAKAVLRIGVRELGLPAGYTGHMYDPLLGAYYARARMYGAADRRFMAMDPIKGTVGNPAIINQYAYCWDNPLKYLDPLGLFTLERNSPYTEMVTILQQYLEKLGYLHVNEGDEYGNYRVKTAEAVSLFGFDRDTARNNPLRSVNLMALLDIVNAGINRAYNLEALSSIPGMRAYNEAVVKARAEYVAVNSQIRQFYSKLREPVPSYIRPFDPCYWSNKPSIERNLDKARIEPENMREFRTRYGDLIEQWAKKLKCSPGALAGIVFAESSLTGIEEGKTRIRFEVHVFRRQAKNYNFELRGNEYVSTHFKHSSIEGKQDTGHQFRTTATGQWRTVHDNNSREYEAYAVASSINDHAAAMSVSYGFAQIMGFNHVFAGFDTAEGFMAAMSTGHTAQINAMGQFILSYTKESNGMTALQALQQENWQLFIRLYNGAGVGSERNKGYVKKIIAGKSAYEMNATRV